MAKLAQSMIDVLLGEATSGTRAQRLEDMVAIASAIENRAAKLGVSVDDVISAKGQFDAFGKSLPAGVEKFRDLAEQAVAQVKAFGPVHNGTFYATPSATKNLPSGLQQVTKTAGHLFFDDPQNRAIATAQGYKTPDPNAVPATLDYFSGMAQPLSKAVETINGIFSRLSPPDVAPTPTPNPTMGQLTYDLAGAQRNQVPTSGIGQKVHDVANSVIPGIDTSLYSGMERRGMAAVGAPNRHPLGFAGDFKFSKNGAPVVDPVALQDIAMGMAAKHNANIGYSQVPGDYMGPGRMHIDTMPLDKFPGGPQWGRTAKSWADNLDFARETGIGPTPYSNAPTPSSRAGAIAEQAMAAKEAAARSQLGQSLAQAGVPGLSKQAASPVRPDNFSAPGQLVGQKAGGLGGLGGVAASAQAPIDINNQLASPPARSPAPTASISPVSLSQTPSLAAPGLASISPTSIATSAVSPETIAANIAASVVSPTRISTPVAPQVTAPAVRPAATPQVTPAVTPAVARTPANNSPSGTARSNPRAGTAADVYAGRADVGVATDGSVVSRDAYGNISITNEFGVTTTTDPTGRQMGGGFGIGGKGVGQGIGNAIGNAVGSIAGHVTPGMIGTVIGGAVGGPLGAMAGAAIGSRMGGGKSQGQRSGGLGGLGGFLSGIFGGGGGGGGSSSGGGSGGRGSSSNGGGGWSSPGADRSQAGM